MLGVNKFLKRMAIALAAIAIMPLAAQADELLVPLDEAVVFTFDEDVATVAVGNPAIAGVSIHDGNIVMVAGRSFGTTNIVALNGQGKPIGNRRIRVTSVGGWDNLTLVRGSLKSIVSYSCAPRCERILVPGDESSQPAEFDKVQAQNGGRAAAANSASE